MWASAAGPVNSRGFQRARANEATAWLQECLMNIGGDARSELASNGVPASVCRGSKTACVSRLSALHIAPPQRDVDRSDRVRVVA